ncbi:MAG: C1 family peptidase [Planctomycetes bacterium]|nr:C1 family peptidase [Planctomycetota bacterium]
MLAAPRVLLLAFSVLALGAGSLSAQTGSIDPTRDELASLKRLGGDEIELIEEQVVDLRRWLPRVGSQGMNDCTAWAVGYAAKSYLEARDQGWKPDHPSRIFSPLFLYNQLNGGQDAGTNFYKMVKFMAEHGCATLATSPYQAGNYTVQPSEAARAEARSYPVLDLVLLENRRAIRRALQRRQLVVFGAHVNPLFLAGSFQLYDPATFVRDGKLRQPGQPHGKHAMVIAGYDDERQAFLVQNSWGERWCQYGYAWVSYELFDRIEITQGDSVFCNWACTIEDLEQDVERLADGSVRAKEVGEVALRAHGASDISHYDRATESYVYTFQAELRGPREALERVARVRWTWLDEQGLEASQVTDFAMTRFSMLGMTRRNPLKLRGELTLSDGTTRTLATEIVGPNPKADFRDAAIRFRDHYHGPGQGGKPLFYWEATLDYPLEQRNDIAKVLWYWGDQKPAEPSMTNTGFNGRPADERAIGWTDKAERLHAEIHYIDGGIKAISRETALRDVVREEFALEIETKRIGKSDAGRPLFSWVLSIDRPYRKVFDIERVSYLLDPLFAPPVVESNDSLGGFPFFGTADRDFRVIATLHLKGGGTQTLERWIELAPDTRYPDDDRVAFDSWNRYLGRENGAPEYTGHVRLVGDRRSLERLDKVYFREETGSDPKEYQVYGGGEHPQWTWGLVGDERAVLHARLVWKDGREKTLRLDHRRTLVPNDTIGFQVSTTEKPTTYLDFEHPECFGTTLQLVAPDQDLLRIASIDWIHRTVGPRERTRQRLQRVGSPELLWFSTVFTQPFTLEAVLHYHTGYEEQVKLSLSRFVSGDSRPPLQLRVREKFWGYENGRPLWQVVLSVARDGNRRTSPLVKTVYRLHSIDLAAPYAPFETNDPEGLFYLRADRPCTLSAELEFQDGTRETLQGELRAMAERSTTEFFLRRYDHGARRSQTDVWLLVLDAWESERTKIGQVFWDAEVDLFDRIDDFTDGVPGLITYGRGSLEPETMKITLRRRSGTEVAFSDRVGELPEPVNWSYTQRYYGDGLWQLDIQAIGSWWDVSKLGKSLRLDDSKGLPLPDVGAWPISRKRVRAPAGPYTISGGHYLSDRPLAGVEIQLGSVETPSESLALSVSSSPFQHPSATTPEWILAIVGPEKLMTRIAKVVYEYEDSKPRVARVTQRWGEFYECFEHRAYAAAAPAVKATVHFEDGTTLGLETKR